MQTCSEMFSKNAKYADEQYVINISVIPVWYTHVFMASCLMLPWAI